jgi:hypothetical protein
MSQRILAVVGGEAAYFIIIKTVGRSKSNFFHNFGACKFILMALFSFGGFDPLIELW